MGDFYKHKETSRKTCQCYETYW